MAIGLKRLTNESIRDFVCQHPDCTYEQVVKELGVKNFSKAHFSTIRWRLRKTEPQNIGSTEKTLPTKTKKATVKEKASSPSTRTGFTTVRILELVDMAEISEVIKNHYKSHILPLLQRLHPDGGKIQFVFLSDPLQLEIRSLRTKSQ